QFSSHLDRMDRNWRSDPFWRDLYPRWAEPIFKEGIDIKTKITNDYQRFAVEVDAYQFRPEEIQVKTVDNTLLIEGRHEDVRDRDNFTKMYFVRKYQLPADIEPADVCSSIDSTGRLTVEAMRRQRLASGRERLVPIEGPSRRGDNRGQQRSSSSNSPRERDRSESETYRNETQGGMESREKHQREYRSEASNGYRSESRSLRRDEYHNDGSLDRNRYRVDSPSTSSRQNGVGDTAKSESRSSVRSVQILRKTFQ
ncbi:Protein lethal(2)essential for life, partial [Toxocara canis]